MFIQVYFYATPNRVRVLNSAAGTTMVFDKIRITLVFLSDQVIYTTGYRFPYSKYIQFTSSPYS